MPLAGIPLAVLHACGIISIILFMWSTFLAVMQNIAVAEMSDDQETEAFLGASRPSCHSSPVIRR